MLEALFDIFEVGHQFTQSVGATLGCLAAAVVVVVAVFGTTGGCCRYVGGVTTLTDLLFRCC